MLTQERLKELFYYCPETGLFTRIVTTASRSQAGDIAGCITRQGYITFRVDTCSRLAHRMAWLYVYGSLPLEQVDHINGVRSDNRLINLRSVTNQENTKNAKIGSNNTSGTMGVSWCASRGKWQTYINVNRKSKGLGWFEYKWDAICARKSAEVTHGYHDNHGRV